MDTISTASGVVLAVTTHARDDTIEVLVERQSGPPCVLHWGLVRGPASTWQLPPPSVLPPGSRRDHQAVQTPLAAPTDTLTLRLHPAWRFSSLDLALFDPKTSRWDSNQGKNYRIVLPASAAPVRTPAEVARVLVGASAPTREATHPVGDGYALAVAVATTEGRVEVALATDLLGPLSLHWGIGAHRHEWRPPEPLPPDTHLADPHAAETAFRDEGDLRTLHLGWTAAPLPPGLCFVLRQPDHERWWNDRGRNFFVSLGRELAPGPFLDPRLVDLAEQIVERETGPGSWTLMHRFDLACELLEQVPSESAPALALLFVWLRFSAIRQLDWQRNYNTKPRELAHAQDRLTAKLAELAAQSSEQRPLWRMLAGTLGRGGEGQRVRDAILEIMHRHGVKEMAGHFLEEWHQKLHNNTTPDDVVICEAYLEFLRHQGDATVFYRTLEAGGVTRQRLHGYERPIRSAPEYIPSLRDAFLHDFGELLGILRSVHSATDFGAALQSARGRLDEGTRQLLDGIWHRRSEPQAATWLLESITRARETLAGQLRPGRAGLRDVLYLDLALEDLLRAVVERHLHEPLGLEDLLAWTELSLRNLLATRPSEPLTHGLAHLRRIMAAPHGGQPWAMHVQAVIERSRRDLVAIADGDYRLLQPIADYLGTAFHAEPWTIHGFSEEVLRGRLDFVVAALVRKLDEGLRPIAKAGDWQWSSRGSGHATGQARKAETMADLGGIRPSDRTVVLVTRVEGTEEIPAGVVALLTEATVDLMSHLAVRARNAGVLLATCTNPERWSKLRAADGQWLRLAVAADGELESDLVEAGPGEGTRPAASSVRPVVPPKPGDAWVIGEDAFSEANVGAKSRNLKQLRRRLPEWINVPKGIALPFGTGERVLADPLNREAAKRQQELIGQLRREPDQRAAEVLARLRELHVALQPPEPLTAALRQALRVAGLSLPSSAADAWGCITRVWASKWNDRAYQSRRAHGIPDDGLVMAVLIQDVVPADYAFVIHTANPLSGNRDELAAEIVLGLGETLVGNHPGRALGIVWNRIERSFAISSFPSKSVGLYGRGLIFRSDSNGEDLAGMAGAGLYDSIMLPAPREVPLDYTKDDLLWNEGARRRFINSLGNLGVMVEKVFGSPQDIEGVYAGARFFVVQSRPQVGMGHG